MTKNEVILVNLPPGHDHTYENAGSIYPSTGIMLIGTILKRKGFSVSLVDGALEAGYQSQVIERISGNTAFVGFSAMTSQIVMAYELAEKIKREKPGTLVVFGGTHPTLFPEQTVSNRNIDIAVINEGARTVLEIMEHINGGRKLADIKGIAFRDESGRVNLTPPRPPEDVEELPHFDFELLDAERYLGAKSVYERELDPCGDRDIRLMPILTGLGCCFRCAFCINVILKRGYRPRPVRSIIDEMKRLQSVYGANAFLFLDEDFCINKKRLAEFVELAKKEGLKFRGRIWTRVSYFRQDSFREMIPKMEEAGICSMAMGAESGSQRVLDYICKDIKKEDILLAAKELSATGITPRFSFIAGIEGENRRETVSTYKLCGELLKMNPRTDIAGPFTFRYYPGSPIFSSMVEKYGIKLPGSIEEWKGALNSDGSLKVDSQDWTWPGFSRYAESMNNYISLCSWRFNRPDSRTGSISRIMRKLLLWRISTGEHLYVIDYYLFRSAKKIKAMLRAALRSLRPLRVREERST